ncbi:hypothetical protein SPRG_12704 [Saprolegnia parasitica CBS 223.65]|uniref:Apple domain-containing protein n=1 Tax=Saprolegnia parasitica (strain CBS 223.65) TaxID=695850 RepID=A0A067BZY9_SAPPC|nr:hypothetical protein SPRG_12704 [Saprolegnia parasitica CBS 223.65]KDO22425.1 hypothetical protein SPRG_12704 [Saprolegnia parasitica CBS 223.65]|eukprot:XP_012206814.1 hypothetical protein SPRG_12704 [Saprolegnia parasitica CBS 223.65]
MTRVLLTLLSAAYVAATANLRQQQFKVCKVDTDCNDGFYCKPTDDGTFAMCQPGGRSPARNFVCVDHADYWGDDLSNLRTGYDGCLYACRTNANCNALAWLQDNAGASGTCYLKRLQNTARAPTPDGRNLKACKDTPPVTTTKWVSDAGYQLKGENISISTTVPTLAACQASCASTPGCAGVSHSTYFTTCMLHKAADNYFPVWSKAVPLGAVASIPHNYKACYDQYDVPHTGDVNNFLGSFQDCAKCMANGNADAFAWYLGPTGAYAQPINAKGTCYCKKLGGSVPPPPPAPRSIGGTILCIN